MNLYQIQLQHTAPKDTETAIACLLLAENDEQVYEWIKSADEVKNSHIYCSWDDNEEEGEEFEIFNDDYEVVGTETFKEKIIRLKGEKNDEDYDYTDAYYGITLYGWELLKENVTTDYSELIELGICFKVKQDKKK